jgi:hypothetical protein
VNADSTKLCNAALLPAASRKDIVAYALCCDGFSHSCTGFANNSAAALPNSARAMAPFTSMKNHGSWPMVVSRKPFSKRHLVLPFSNYGGNRFYTIEQPLRSHAPAISDLPKI